MAVEDVGFWGEWIGEGKTLMKVVLCLLGAVYVGPTIKIK